VVIGNHTQGLGIVRSAAEVCDTVWAVNDCALTLSRFSHHLSGFRRLPPGTLGRLEEPDCAAVLTRALLELPVEHPAVLFGVDEDITAFIHRNRDALGHRYVVPDVQLQRIYDKHAFNLELPEPARIDTRLCSETDLETIDDPGRFILKGRQGSAFRRVTGEKALRLDTLTSEDKVALFRQIGLDRVIVQEVIESERPVVSVCSFSVGGELANMFGYEKLRQHPDRFGTGTYLRSIDVAALRPLAEAVLERVGYTGISEIELVHDRRTGTYKVIEMNPRTWKSVHFATRCGQNLVARQLAFAVTGEATTDLGYEQGRYWADLATDVPEMIRRGKLWGYDRSCFECTWDRRDPLPALALWTLFPLMLAEERLHGRASKRDRPGAQGRLTRARLDHVPQPSSGTRP
jgi:predicted ATP-grasp superfamily ATP-dependent carboligase